MLKIESEPEWEPKHPHLPTELTVAEAANLLQCSIWAIYSMIASGKLPARRLPRLRKYLRSAKCKNEHPRRPALRLKRAAVEALVRKRR